MAEAVAAGLGPEARRSSPVLAGTPPAAPGTSVGAATPPGATRTARRPAAAELQEAEVQPKAPTTRAPREPPAPRSWARPMTVATTAPRRAESWWPQRPVRPMTPLQRARPNQTTRRRMAWRWSEARPTMERQALPMTAREAGPPVAEPRASAHPTRAWEAAPKTRAPAQANPT